MWLRQNSFFPESDEMTLVSRFPYLWKEKSHPGNYKLSFIASYLAGCQLSRLSIRECYWSWASWLKRIIFAHLKIVQLCISSYTWSSVLKSTGQFRQGATKFKLSTEPGGLVSISIYKISYLWQMFWVLTYYIHDLLCMYFQFLWELKYT